MSKQPKSSPNNSTTLSIIINRTVFWLVVLFIAALILIPVGMTVKVRSDARLALSEAKNVKLAMTLMGTESYGTGSSLFDANGAGGINSQYISDLKTFADVNGTLAITGWNQTKDELESFTYRTGSFTVHYEKDFATGEEHWKVDYSVPILQY